MNLNLSSFIFLFLRLSPFILICFFTLSSIFNNDLRGIIYLFGLLISIFTAFSVGNNLNLDVVRPEDKHAVCDFVFFSGSDSRHIPVGETILAYTFFYLFTTIVLKDKEFINTNVNFEHFPNVPSLNSCLITPWQMLKPDFIKFLPTMFTNLPALNENISTITFFMLLIAFDIFWNTNIFSSIKKLLQLDLKYCYTTYQSGIAYFIGIIIGIIWSTIIYSTNSPHLQYFPGYKNNEVCKKAGPTKYSCKVYKNGELLKVLD
jgi:hypothetical protein